MFKLNLLTIGVLMLCLGISSGSKAEQLAFFSDTEPSCTCTGSCSDGSTFTDTVSPYSSKSGCPKRAGNRQAQSYFSLRFCRRPLTLDLDSIECTFSPGTDSDNGSGVY